MDRFGFGSVKELRNDGKKQEREREKERTTET